ncbi:MAG TPA: hypothetical protein VE621_10900 [Bryobacteraceae bacterium]|nr:hypothetical protein [Bryobacteraceae bacterium]
MKSFRLLASGALICAIAAGDTITLKSGRTIQGTFLSGDSRQIRVALEDRVETLPISEVDQIRFGGPTVSSVPAERPAPPPPAAAAQAEPAPRAEIMRSDREYRTPDPRTPAAPAEVPAGTTIQVRMIDDVDSERDRVGQEFRASVDEPVVVNGETVIPRGANVVAKLVDDKQSGKLSGRTELTLDLVSVEVNGRPVDVSTQEVTQASGSRTGKTAKVVGGTAVLGTIIGAIAGGGKGAAIGAASGAAAGGAVQVMTKGERVRIPSETRLNFTLQQPLNVSGSTR